jgi:branched-subunit amino acid aminotransferase/4-amino-4-deoxychorismate lyase
MIAFNNGIYIDANTLMQPINSLAVNRGFGAYEFFEVMHQTPFYLERHIQRFVKTLKVLHLSIAYEKELTTIVHQLLVRNKQDNTFVKFFALPLNQPGERCNAGFYAFLIDFPRFRSEQYAQGFNLILREYKRFLPEAKSTNYLASEYFRSEMETVQAADVLFYDGNQIRESSRGNVFVVKNGVVFTPKKEILFGITRSIVIDIMIKAKIPFEVCNVSIEMLNSADEVFITSTTKQIMPIVQIDNRMVGKGVPGNVSMQLLEMFLGHKQKVINTTEMR